MSHIRMNIVKAICFASIFIVSCGGMNCPMLGKYLAPLRQDRGDEVAISELLEKLELELKKPAKVRSNVRLSGLYEQLGSRYLYRRMWDPAIKNMEKAIGLGQSGSSLHNNLGIAYANRGKELGKDEDFDRAESQYRRSLEIHPERNDAAYGLAVLLFYHRDRKSEAIELLENMVRGYRVNYPARFGLARMYYDTGKLAEALSQYQELCAEFNSAPDTPEVREYKSACRENIQRVSAEIANKR